MTYMLRTLAFIALVGFMPALMAHDLKNMGPQELIRDTADKVIEMVTVNREALEKDNSCIFMLVENTVVPKFDFYRMSQTALGRFWRRATDEQKKNLAHEFKELLVRTYAVALLNYSGQQIEYLPVRMKDGDTEVMIPTRIKQSGGPPIPIQYRLHKKEGWLVYDVIIDGISLVSNYRSTFAAEVRKGGIDGLIKTLADKNNKMRSGA